MEFLGRIIAAAALLLHTALGCSVHHACACDDHGHAPTAEISHHSCDHDHATVQSVTAGALPELNCPGDHNDAATEQLVAACTCCDSAPCDGSTPACHTEIACSFVPADALAFDFDTVGRPTVLPTSNLEAAISSAQHVQGSIDRSDPVIYQPKSRCAFLCTWLI